MRNLPVFPFLMVASLTLLSAAPAWAAGGVTGISVTPTKGVSATQFTVNIQGTGQCDVQISTAKDGADGWVSTLTENQPMGGFPREWKYKPPALLGSSAAQGALPVGKYTVKVRALPPNVCNKTEYSTSFEVVAPVNLAPLPKCSEGWTLVNHTAAGGYTCKPKKPAASTCPPKHEWFDDGCSAGCRQVAY